MSRPLHAAGRNRSGAPPALSAPPASVGYCADTAATPGSKTFSDQRLDENLETGGFGCFDHPALETDVVSVEPDAVDASGSMDNEVLRDLVAERPNRNSMPIGLLQTMRRISLVVYAAALRRVTW